VTLAARSQGRTLDKPAVPASGNANANQPERLMFLPAQGLDYRNFLDAMHQQLRFDWYLEIGSQTGMSLAKSRSPSVAVDPVFNIRHDIAGNKAQLHLFQETSDDFFDLGRLKTLKVKPNLSFLDGMHLFEYLLRDFMNAEAAGTPTSIIALHDCCPFDHGMTTRNVDKMPKGPWTGDVWKLVPILQEYRPDLKLQVFDCAPTGLVLLSGLDPKNRKLRQNYNRILSRYVDLTLESFGPDRFYQSFTYTDAQAEVDAGFPSFRPAANKYYVSAEAIAPQTDPVTPVERVRGPLDRMTVHGIDFYATHEVLRDVARDLSRTITRPPSRPVDVYVGVHNISEPVKTGRFRIGIQTEQFFDAHGKRMWRVPRERFIRRYALFYDRLLDLSASNMRLYDELPPELRSKVSFGPHIFPDTPVVPDFKPTPPLFFGSINTRRNGVLRKLLMHRPIGIAPRWTFGADLDRLIAAHGSVLNLHFVEGFYSEYPRLLKAYLRGKPLLSEPLPAPLQAGKHYLDLKADPTKAATAALFKSLGTFATAHSFQRFLDTALAEADLQPAGR
jgi:hypothetical protein